jgi:ribosomal protein L11 methylase PrmA
MGATIPGGTIRKEVGWPLPPALAEPTLGNNLMNTIIAKQLFVEKGMTIDAGIFEEKIQRLREELSQVGLDPDKIIKERVRLLTEALQKKT